jgi:adenylylsulfate kinase
MGKNVVWHESRIKKGDRIKLLAQRPFVLWITGLSGSGKSSIANAVEVKLHSMGIKTYLLDGDNIRHGLNKDLGFDEKSREENIRRIGEVAKLFVDSGLVVITAFISPFAKDRALARALVQEDEFVEVFIDTPLEVCESRDPKGLYKKARDGEIKDFTGIDSPYEVPLKPELHIKSSGKDISKIVEKIVRYLKEKEYISC